MTSALLAAGNARADIKQTLGFDVFGASNRVLEKRVTPINDDVAAFEQRNELLDELINRLPCLHHQHHTAGLLEQADHFLQRVGPYYVSAFGLVMQKVIYFRNSAIECDHREPVVVHVQD